MGSSYVRVIVNVSTNVKDESLAVIYISLSNGGIGASRVSPLKVKSSVLNYSQYAVVISSHTSPLFFYCAVYVRGSSSLSKNGFTAKKCKYTPIFGAGYYKRY